MDYRENPLSYNPLAGQPAPFSVDACGVRYKIRSRNIEDATITACDIATGTVTAGNLAACSVDSAEIVAGAVDAAHMAANSVDSASIVAGAVDNTHLSGGFFKIALITGGAAGNHTVTGIAACDELVFVGHFSTAAAIATLADITCEFTISCTNTINNACGTATCCDQLQVFYIDLT